LETKDSSSADHYLPNNKVCIWPPQNDKTLISGQHLNLTPIDLLGNDESLLVCRFRLGHSSRTFLKYPYVKFFTNFFKKIDKDNDRFVIQFLFPTIGGHFVDGCIIKYILKLSQVNIKGQVVD
jgi:hypothetical protein